MSFFLLNKSAIFLLEISATTCLHIIIAGIAVIGAYDFIHTYLVSRNQITDYSFVTQPFKLDRSKGILRCATGLGPSGDDRNNVLGGWFFNGRRITLSEGCQGPVVEQRAAGGKRYPGVINLYLCGTFTTTEEGVYSCIMMNSSMMNQTIRVGVYLSGRSELFEP